MDGNAEFDKLAKVFGELWAEICEALDHADGVVDTASIDTAALCALFGGTFRNWMAHEIAAWFCESPMESRYYKHRMSTSDIGLKLVPQYQIGPYRVDFAVPSMKQVIEIDGREFHTKPDDVARDQERDKALAAEGWHVERITGATVNRTCP